MFCQYCGKELDDEMNFCGKCGKRVSMKGEDLPEQSNVVPSKKSSGNEIIIGGIIILICIAIYFVNYTCGLPFKQDAGEYIGKKAKTISMYRYMKKDELLSVWEMKNIWLMDLNEDNVVDTITSTESGFYKIEGISCGMSYVEAIQILRESYEYNEFDYDVYDRYMDGKIGEVTIGYSEERDRYILLTCVDGDIKEIQCISGYMYEGMN